MQLTCHLGDLTVQAVDAIVNAANSSLLGGGGVDGAIHAAAGPQLLQECRAVRADRFPDGLPVGEAVATGAGHLPARWVIHTVGPNRHRGQTEPGLLASCFRRSLEVAEEVGAETVAFPAVSAGIYGWDPATVADVAVATVREWAKDRPEAAVKEVRFVLFSPPILRDFERALATEG
ncbi:O-acetyl-ADP-ribose deacetylase [Ornithinimicrobium pratense]|uniref:O-acetyl-ADP-ribose deacetylase n=1 Tax=Ornithinimicrobium pratense TaxID=2593973 RepID=A0A5J6V1P3_9MICO|nr:O-acetyl-ADP-ribose deacetylase [Ornithinimicrobium pratense]QFG67535.1 O-acetyl-ADP-ribose deacetylase [Ornithinimicrobium pratense]